MVDNRSGGGPNNSWLPWLIGIVIVLAALTAIDLAFYRDDIRDEAHEEELHEEGVVETEEGAGVLGGPVTAGVAAGGEHTGGDDGH